MTKIVINASYGGFSLSDKAIARYAELKGLNLVQVEVSAGWADVRLWFYDGDTKRPFYSDDVDRADPALVQVVEELSATWHKQADGFGSTLEIVELDPGTRYYIDEYDGKEHVVTEDSIHWSVA